MIGMALCQNGQTQIHKVYEDWQAGEFDEKVDENASTETMSGNDSESKGNKENQTLPLESCSVARFMENVTYKDICDWTLYLSERHPNIYATSFVKVLQDVYGVKAGGKTEA